MSSRVWIGIGFLLIGSGFLLHQANVLDLAKALSTWWPLILMIIGIIQVVNRTYSSVVSGLLIFLIGLIFFVNSFFDMNLTAYLWPLIMIFIGIAIIFTRLKREKTSHTVEDLNTFAIFSGAEIRSRSNNFRGGSVTTIFGGAEIDLREAGFTEEGAVIDLTAIFGGISITVPEHIHVEFTGLPVFGGWEDKTRTIAEGVPSVLLKLNCLTVAGGVEVKN